MPKLIMWSLLIVFSLVIAFKDIVTKELMVNGVSLYEILLVGGAVSLVLTCFMQLILKEKVQTFSQWKSQGVRFLTSMLVWFLVTSSFKTMSASSVSIFSKVYIPLFILLGDWLQVSYSPKQKKFALAAFLLLVIFLVIKMLEGEQVLGYLLLLLSVGIVMFEFVLLRNASRSQSSFDVIIIPTLACITVGLLGSFSSGASLSQLVNNPSVLLNLGCFGLLFNLYYLLSTYRYKIFPLGISEYPSLLAVFPIVAFEYLVKQKQPEMISLTLIFLVTLLLAQSIKVERAKI